MSGSNSVKYVKGWSTNTEFDPETPHYFVNLSEKHLYNFEILNALTLLGNYENLLTFIELQVQKVLTVDKDKQELLVPPFDVWIILLTIGTVTNVSKDQVLNDSDVYNQSRISLNKRALKLLSIYNRILIDFDTKKYSQYDLELLRCQIFLVLDTILPRTEGRTIGSSMIRTLRVKMYSPAYTELRNPYSSYKDCLQQLDSVLGSKLIHKKLTQPGEMANLLLFTFSNSLPMQQDNKVQFLTVYETWISFFPLLFEMISLRQNYYIENETTKVDAPIEPVLFIQRLIESPIARYFRVINSTQFIERFIEYVFVDCPDDKNQTRFVNEANDPKSFNISSTYMDRTFYPPDYTVECSMRLRRHFAFLGFHLLSVVPNGCNLISPRMETNKFISEMASELYYLRDVTHFESFLLSDNLERDIIFIPLLLETVFKILLNERSELFDTDGYTKTIKPTEHDGGEIHKTRNYQPEFVNSINNFTVAVSEYEVALNLLYIKSDRNSKAIKQEEYELKLKGFICVMIMFNFCCFANASHSQREIQFSLKSKHFRDSVRGLRNHFYEQVNKLDLVKKELGGTKKILLRLCEINDF